MGRRKIEIQPLADDRNRTVTFVKRKAGLFKKAHELAVLCQVDLAVIIIGNNNKLYEFSSVDTNELIDVYKNTKTPHESKSPANYGNYKKKQHLSSNASIINDDVMDEYEIDSDYDSESPEPRRSKRQKRSYDAMTANSAKKSQSYKQRPNPPSHISLGNVPTFNNYRSNPAIKEEDDEEDKRSVSGKQHYRTESTTSNATTSSNHRPVLRVQIPTDSKGNGTDSAQTITALDTNLNHGTASGSNTSQNDQNVDSSIPTSSRGHNPSMPNINTPKYSSFGTFKSPDTRKPITTLPIPVHSKSQTSSPQSATAPGLPVSATFFNGLPQASPSSQYPSNASVQTPILNQVFNSQYPATDKGDHPNPANPQSSLQINLQNKYRSYHNSMGGEQTPVSGLPSRYVNDIFPSPSNFYAPQEWPSTASGMTPFHNNMPQYFMNMLPSAGGNGQVQAPGSFQGQRPPNIPQQQQQQQQQQQPNAGNSGQQNPQYQNFQRNEAFASPLQYMGPFNANPNANAEKK